MFKKLAGILLIFCALVFIAIGAAFFALSVLSGSQKAKKAILYGIKGYSGRDASLRAIKISPFSGINIDDFSLSNYPDFKTGTLLSVKSIVFTPGILSLLRQKLNIGEFIVDSPVIRIKQRSNGSFNFESLDWIFKNQFANKAAWPFFLANCIVKDGTLHISDKNGHVTQFGNITINISGLSASNPSPASLSFKVEGNQDFLVTIKGNVILKDKKIEVTEINLTTANQSLSGKGTINIASETAPYFDFHFKGDINTLTPLISAQPIPALVLIGGQQNTNFTFSATKEGLKIKKE